jgi:hypothetical protein
MFYFNNPSTPHPRNIRKDESENQDIICLSSQEQIVQDGDWNCPVARVICLGFCLFVCSHTSNFFQLCGVFHHNRWHGYKCRPMLSTCNGFQPWKFFYVPHLNCDTRPPFSRSYPKNLWFSLVNAAHLAKEQSLPILTVLGLTRSARAGLELTTSRVLSYH